MEREGTFILLLILEKMISVFSTEYNVSYVFVVFDLYCVRMCPFSTQSVENIYHKRIVYSVKFFLHLLRWTYKICLSFYWYGVSHLLLVMVYNGEGNGTPLQYSCLENPMDRGAWWAAVHGVAEGRTRLSDFTFTFHFHALEKEMATHSSVRAWRIPGMEEPGGLPSMGLHRVRHDWRDLAAAAWCIILLMSS